MQTGQCVTSESGCQGGKTKSLSRLNSLGVSKGSEYDGGGGSGRSRSGTGDESSTIGSELEPSCELLRALILEGRRIGDSAVVRRLLRSELLPEDDVSVRGGGREGKANGEDEDEGFMLGAVEVWVSCGRMYA